MKIALFGGAGFVGSRMSSVFSEGNIEFQVFDKVLAGDNFTDITLEDTFTDQNDFDVAINLAAEHRDDVTPKSRYDLVNVKGSENVCNFCRTKGINRIIFTSSVAVYGFAPEGADETGAINYFNDYGRTKYLAEQVYQRWYAESPDTRSLVIVRPTVIFGEANRGNVYNLLKQIASGKFIMIGGGTNRKSMAYVENVAEFIKYMTKSDQGLHIYNYIDKPDLDMNALVDIIRKKIFNKKLMSSVILITSLHYLRKNYKM